MNRIIISLLLAFTALSVTAATYTMAEVPNVYLTDSTRCLSNPDGIISPRDAVLIDATLRDIRRQTTVEAVAVAVDNIDPEDIDTFATELFEHWGLGKTDKDNGLLILLVRDLRLCTIRPGYGLEGVLPDIVCAGIIRNKIAPAAREGDYGTALVAATDAIRTILTDPDARAEVTSALADRRAGDGTDPFVIYLYICGILAAGMVVLLIVRVASVSGRSRHDRYLALSKLKPFYLAATFIGLGMPLLASVPLLIILYRLRNAPRACPHCGTQMKKIDEVHDNEYLDPAQDFEERIGSVDYDVWLCPNCGERDIEEYVTPSTGYRVCSYCHTRASHLTRTRILRQPTTLSKGHGVHEYTCRRCNNVDTEPFDIPALPPVVIVPGSGRGGGGFGGGGFGGGSFGGGHTGGGGATGGW